MTREEAIELLKRIKKGNYLGGIIDIPSDESIALDMAIKALEQKPSEDCISRKAAIEAVMDLCKYYTPTKSVNHPHMDFVIETLQDLSPVTPQSKTGHWLAKSFHEVYCDNCKFDFDIMTNEFIDKMKYCPNCGAKMSESEEEQ